MQIERWEFADWEAALEHYFREGLTDGLPVVPPTQERVQALLDYCGLAAEEVLGTEGIRHKRFPAGKVAVSAVMAGCLPEHFPVVVAAVSAVCDRAYNFHASSTSTNGIANLVLVSGPYASRIGINHGVNAFGNGNRANAAIGRAINLLKANFYGSVSQEMDKSTFGHSGKYSFCFAEDLETSPWPSLAESKGFRPGSSTVTMVAANAPLQLETHGDRDPEGFPHRGGPRDAGVRAEAVGGGAGYQPRANGLCGGIRLEPLTGGRVPTRKDPADCGRVGRVASHGQAAAGRRPGRVDGLRCRA